MNSKISKFGLFFTIICNVSFTLCFIIGVIITMKFDCPNIIDPNEFTIYMKNNGCNLIDLAKQQELSGFETYLITDTKSCPYQFTYAIFNDNNRFNKFFLQIRDDILNKNNNVTGSTTVSMFSKYSEYSTSGDYYKVVTQNNNSILYASVEKNIKQIH